MQNIGTEIKASEAVSGQVIDTPNWGRIAVVASETAEGVTEMTDGVRWCLLPGGARATGPRRGRPARPRSLERSHEPPEPKEPTMTDTAELLALLAAAPQEAVVAFDDDDMYIDWSTRDDQDRICFEVGAPDGAAALHLTRDQLVEVYRSVGLWLIQNPES